MNSIQKEDIEWIIQRIPYECCEGKTFLIAGANGFIASYMTDTLMYLNENCLKNKCTVIALCRNREKAEQRFAEWVPKKEFILQIQGVEDNIPDNIRADYIVHAASYASTKMFKLKPVDILSANVIGTYNLLEFAKKSHALKFVFLSSGAVYGEIGNFQNAIKENDVFPLDFCLVENCYAEGKRCGEAMCCAFFRQYNLPVSIVRVSHTYGPGIDLRDGHVYSDFVSRIINAENLIIKDGGATRSFCYIVDAAVAFFKVLFEGKAGEVYNMANVRETFSIYQLAMKLANEAFGERNISVECQNKSISTSRTVVNIDKLKSLGWNASINVVEGFKRTVKSFEEERLKYESEREN